MANILYQTSYLESWGSGAKRIMDVCKAHNVSEPEWSIQARFVVVTFKRRMSQKKSAIFIKDVIKEKGIELTERQEEILKVLREDSTQTSQKILQKQPISSRTIIADMSALQKYGLLRRVGGRKNGYGEVILPDDIIEIL